MRYTIMGFNQREVVNSDLTLDELLLLDYIIVANGTPSMYHVVDDEKSYVWLSHSKLNEDLPILRISDGTLKNKLSKLKSRGYICSITLNNKSGKGSRTYYSVTDLTTSLRNDVVTTTTSQKNDVVERPRHEKMTSDNILNNTNKKLNKDKNKSKILDSIISKFTLYDFSEAVQDKLIDFYSDRIEAKQKPTEHQLIATLDLLAGVDEKTQLLAIDNSIRGGWKTIYLPKASYDNKQSYRLDNDIESLAAQKARVDNLKQDTNKHTF